MDGRGWRAAGEPDLRGFHLLPQPGQSPHPEHSHGAHAPAHALGDLVVRQALDVAQEDDLGIIGGEPREGIGQAELELVAAGLFAGRRAGGRERVAQPTRRLGKRLLERDLTADIAPLGTPNRRISCSKTRAKIWRSQAASSASVPPRNFGQPRTASSIVCCTMSDGSNFARNRGST